MGWKACSSDASSTENPSRTTKRDRKRTYLSCLRHDSFIEEHPAFFSQSNSSGLSPCLLRGYPSPVSRGRVHRELSARPHPPSPKMTPPCHSFPAAELPLKVQLDKKGRKRKTEGGGSIDLLSGCELLGFAQYSCSVDHPEIRDSPVRCWPVQRWFRR
jgi:hypothetical protein